MSPLSRIKRGQTAPWSKPIIAGALAVLFIIVLERENTTGSCFGQDGVTTYKSMKQCYH